MDTHLCFLVKYIFSARHAGLCKHRPLQTIYRFAANIYASPRRGEAPRPANNFQVWQRIIKCSVGNGLDRSGCSPYFDFVGHCLQVFGTVKTVPYKLFLDLHRFL